MAFEPKTKLGKKLYEVATEVDDAINEGLTQPAVKEVVNIAINSLETVVKATPTKVDDIIAKAFFSYFRARYKI